jgi:hypothetical protein
MGETELRLDASELNRLVITCDRCQTELAFNGGAKLKSPGPHEMQCPECRQPIAGLGQLVFAYRVFYEEMAREPSRKVSFLVRGAK